jgi:hypothetical protein
VKTAKKTERAHGSFLRDILGIGPTVQQPTREVKSGIQVRQHQLLKPRPVLRIQHVQTFPFNSGIHRGNRLGWDFIP